MNSLKIKAVILLFFHLLPSKIIQVTEQPLPDEGERKLMGKGELIAAGAFVSFFLGKHLLNLFSKKKPATWENDAEWEDRFVAANEIPAFTTKFLNMLLLNYSMELGNICIKHFTKLYEEKRAITVMTSPAFLSKFAVSSLQPARKRNNDHCTLFGAFVISHGFITKFLMNANYALFYFKISFATKARKLQRDVEDPLFGQAPEEYIDWFIENLQTSIDGNDIWSEADRLHQAFMYNTVNFFLTADHELKKIAKKL